MARRSSRSDRIKMRKSKSGMSRFYSPANLARYRKLASGAIGDTERCRIMQDLAREIQSFKREARVPTADGPRPCEEDVPQAGRQV